MTTKIFKDKNLKVRELSEYSPKDTKRFLDFINSLVREKVQILLNKEMSLKEERIWIKGQLKEVKSNKKVSLVAEDNNMIIGSVEVGVGNGRADHVGTLHIAIRDGYRRIGLGKYLMESAIKLTKRRLRVKVIKIPVFATNKPAIGLYKSRGFREVARIPKQFRYKGKLVDEIIFLRYL